MPRPVYILCVQSSSEDRESNLLSLFGLVENFQITPIPAPLPNQPVFVLWQPIRAVGAWLAEADDGPADEYESELRVFIPGIEAPFVVATGVFRFRDPLPARPLHRFVVNFPTPLPLAQPGTMCIEHRIRRKGTEEWLSQDYPVIVEQVQPPTDPPAQNQPA